MLKNLHFYSILSKISTSYYIMPDDWTWNNDILGTFIFSGFIRTRWQDENEQISFLPHSNQSSGMAFNFKLNFIPSKKTMILNSLCKNFPSLHKNIQVIGRNCAIFIS
jgi:hypothetical protein